MEETIYHHQKLVVIDGYTNKVLPEVDLHYDLGDTQVTIVNNTTGMYEIKPTIIPTQNTNGVGISSLTFNSSTKVVRLYLNQTFSTSREFPFNLLVKKSWLKMSTLELVLLGLVIIL